MRWPRKVLTLLPLGLAAGSVERFDATYKSLGGKDRRIIGVEPSGTTTGLPVFIWLMGTGDTFGSAVDITWLEIMANRGFIAGAVDYASSMNRLIVKTLLGPAKAFQDFRSKAETIPNAISKLCERPRANCSAGVAVAGHSQGGFITIFSPEFDRRITAVLPMGVGCIDNYLPNELADGRTSQYLNGSHRLYIDGAADSVVEPTCLSTMTTARGGSLLVPHAHHQFYGSCDPTRPETRMKCSYGHSSERWGLKAVADWLAKAAAPTKARIVTQPDVIDCDEQPLNETPDCGSVPTVLIAAAFACLFLGGCLCFVCYRVFRKRDYDTVDGENGESSESSLRSSESS